MTQRIIGDKKYVQLTQRIIGDKKYVHVTQRIIGDTKYVLAKQSMYNTSSTLAKEISFSTLNEQT